MGHMPSYIDMKYIKILNMTTIKTHGQNRREMKMGYTLGKTYTKRDVASN